jgi:hypothetical protein
LVVAGQSRDEERDHDDRDGTGDDDDGEVQGARSSCDGATGGAPRVRRDATTEPARPRSRGSSAGRRRRLVT